MTKRKHPKIDESLLDESSSSQPYLFREGDVHAALRLLMGNTAGNSPLFRCRQIPEVDRVARDLIEALRRHAK